MLDVSPSKRLVRGLAALVAAALVTVVAGAEPMADPPGESVKFETVQRATQGGPEKAATTVVNSAKEWAALWGQYHAGMVPAPALPEVDFNKQMVVAVAMGQKPSGGYAVEVTRVEKGAKGLVVHYRETAPGPGAFVTLAITRPFHIVRLAKGTPVSFVKDK